MQRLQAPELRGEGETERQRDRGIRKKLEIEVERGIETERDTERWGNMERGQEEKRWREGESVTLCQDPQTQLLSWLPPM